jgi:predicted transport protein
MLIAISAVDAALLLGLLIYSTIRFGIKAKKDAAAPSAVEPIDYKHGVTAEEFARELELARAKIDEEAGEKVVAATEEPQPIEEEPLVEEPVIIEEPVEAPVVEEEIIEEPVIEEQPAPAEELVISEVEDDEDDREAARRIPFCEKMLYIDRKTQEYYNEINNEFKSYRKIHARVSAKGVSYRLGRELVAKLTVRGKTMKLHLALNVADFEQKVFFQKDLSEVKPYQEVPFAVKVKSDRGLKNAIKLITALAEKKEIARKTRFEPTDGIEELKAIAIELR